MTKQQLRNIYKQMRIDLPEKDRVKMDDLLLIKFQQLVLQQVNVIMSYQPIRVFAEINTYLLTDYLQFRIPGLQVAYPVIKNGTMEAVVVNDDTCYELNDYNIPEPVDGIAVVPDAIDIVITPLLAFDELGYRVGYGKGYYDKFFVSCRKDITKIGFSYFDPVKERIEDINEWDVPLDYCITPNTIYEF